MISEGVTVVVTGQGRALRAPKTLAGILVAYRHLLSSLPMAVPLCVVLQNFHAVQKLLLSATKTAVRITARAMPAATGIARVRIVVLVCGLGSVAGVS